MKGDIDGDSDVDANDVAMLFYHVAGESLLSGDELDNADINGDGAINIRDALRVFQYVNGEIVAL